MNRSRIKHLRYAVEGGGSGAKQPGVFQIAYFSTKHVIV